MPFNKNGSIYSYKGRDVVLYPVSRLTQALAEAGYPRSIQTIRLWEAKNIMPPTIFRVGNKRLYTQEQIDVITAVAVECDITQGARIELTGFPERVYEELEKLHNYYNTREKQLS